MPDLDIVGFDAEPLVAFAYLSTPTARFTDRDLSDLLIASRRYNAAYGVTGKLVVLEDGDQIVRFAQWIEGAKADLERVVRRILADTRHGHFEVRHRGRIDRRRFPG